MSTTYSPTDLPRFVPNSSGHSLPKEGPTAAVCEVPETTQIEVPAWGQTLTALAGEHYHQCLTVDGDNVDQYPNNEYLAYYEEVGELDPATDPRAAFLRRVRHLRGRRGARGLRGRRRHPGVPHQPWSAVADQGRPVREALPGDPPGRTQAELALNPVRGVECMRDVV